VSAAGVITHVGVNRQATIMGSVFFSQPLAGFLKTAAVLAPVSDEVPVEMSARQRIKEAFNANDRVAQFVHPLMPTRLASTSPAVG
jgi:hypothetical protein